MKPITKGITKRLILDIINNLDEVDAKGVPCKRTSIPKDFYRGFAEIQEKIAKTVEIAVMPKGGVIDPATGNPKELTQLTNDDIEWVLSESFKQSPDKKVIGERLTDTPIEFSEKAIKTLKYFYDARQEIPVMPVEALDEIEQLFTSIGQ